MGDRDQLLHIVLVAHCNRKAFAVKFDGSVARVCPEPRAGIPLTFIFDEFKIGLGQ